MSLLLLMGDSTPSIGSLFANNEAGLALDVETAYRRGWVYQDSAGATVAGAAGDPVGLILDTSRGGLDSLGSDLVSNGTFATDTVWSKGANWTIGSGVATKTGGAANNLTQTITSTAGLWYRITMDVTRSAGTLTVSLGTSGTTYAITATGTYTFFILAGSSTQTLTLAGDSSFAGTVDNVTARLVPGNHAYQTTSGSRPALARTPDGGRRNLLTYTEQFDNVAWTKTNSTISANATTAPDGTSTADTLIDDATNADHKARQSIAITSGTTYTVSVYAKANTLNFVWIYAGTPNVGRVFNLATGATGGAVGNAPTSSAISAIGNGWYRCSITYTAGATSTQNHDIGTSPDGTSINYIGTGQSAYLWGAQLEVGSSATAYQKVGLTSDVTESGKRDCWGLLFDGSDDSLVTASVDFNTWTQTTRRNLLVDTESFGSSSWTRGNITAADNTTDTTDPLGTNTSTKLTASSSVVRCAQNFTGRTAGENWVFSFYVKAGTATQSEYLVSNGLAETSNSSGVFTFSSATFSGALGTYVTSRTATSVGNGWYRIVLICTIPSGQTAIRFNPALPIVNTETAYYWGAQAELATSATDYQRVGTDKMTVMAGVRKNSDALSGMLCELSALASSNNGAFNFLAPRANNEDSYAITTNGISAVNLRSYTGNAAPRTDVLSFSLTPNAANSSAAIAARQNGVSVAGIEVLTAASSGNFGNYALFIGSRNSASIRFSGLIYTLIVRGAATPTGTIADFEKNLLRLRAGLGPF